MTSAQVVETSVTNNSSFQNYPQPDDHTIRTTDTPGFKPFTTLEVESKKVQLKKGQAKLRFCNKVMGLAILIFLRHPLKVFLHNLMYYSVF